tara:strand:- start:332 stop:454 length:123 start_codon:yes stop_codon:yes gene_type:complete
MKDMKKIQMLVADLGWEYDRMSSSGQETYEELCKILKIEL